ncbi:nascent polypeptide-associated complex protein [Candidatus Woesearchaeota archaeon]|jgi:nascent polypeptide-associated complex subunit alpha|nr:nascent polypeptide-associated complex protein [Candidatus Woesearchaeota archaeon]MBT3537533.1 nascent polypeptide-associated complex protein [Candidatus Woesearchaeota archaeon]MBT4696837.1 nascent polypeptide-associated complex protein [Candidatus Woesearchaeota archaeon]MBT4717284.1 nascent polypeptide-associated complex protein [Candidatus Woesearchaeota archaeon]MBT7106157.1 nascent polypeptide-associated complex protein [Candidatus Woesearchaeota archaeon]
MIPGMNPRKMQQMMKKMGVAQQDIEATRVIIETPEKNLIIDEPQVAKVNMMGQETLQVSGQIREEEKDTTPELSEDDIKTLMEQANVSEEIARKALELTKGDIAEAIMGLTDDS